MHYFFIICHCVVFADWRWIQDASPANNKDKPHQCNMCGKMYLRHRSLWRHKRYECGKPAMFKCPFCQYRAKQKIHVKQHVLHTHRNAVITNYTLCY
ncbi:hypothetical protein L9F63_027645 [Diploptera punctata]|uniref:C2H2-type domain-containing protein n=1 Tax=Diploptera punctata TaxID=6984 RepID=A0AAD8EKD8_DIPPU|nr:hypothetical protein L9F63_027645 [Diploptera punctata]